MYAADETEMLEKLIGGRVVRLYFLTAVSHLFACCVAFLGAATGNSMAATCTASTSAACGLMSVYNGKLERLCAMGFRPQQVSGFFYGCEF